MTVVRSLLVALLLLALAPAAALAAPPPNDARAEATTIAALPSTQSGTTAEATTEPVEPRSPCFCNGGSVWYRYVAATNGRLVLTLTAAGDLDATLDAYLQQRSQLTREDSDVSDAKGEASVSVRVRAGQAYLVRVAQRVGSVAGTFKLVFDAAAPEVSPPGRLLGRHGASDTLDRVLKPADAFSYRMRAGTTYRINFIGLDLPGVDADSQPTCRAALDVYAPGTRDFADDPVRGLDCGSYVLFTPGRGESGRYPLRVLAPSFARGPQRFHLQIAPAEASDTAPGLPLTNHQRARGALRGSGVDVILDDTESTTNVAGVELCALRLSDDVWFAPAENLATLVNDVPNPARFTYKAGTSQLDFHSGVRPLHGQNGAGTFLFYTRNSSLGLLQIRSIVDNPRRAKLRFKLVQPSAPPGASIVGLTGMSQSSRYGTIVDLDSSEPRPTTDSPL